MSKENMKRSSRPKNATIVKIDKAGGGEVSVQTINANVAPKN